MPATCLFGIELTPRGARAAWNLLALLLCVSGALPLLVAVWTDAPAVAMLLALPVGALAYVLAFAYAVPRGFDAGTYLRHAAWGWHGPEAERVARRGAYTTAGIRARLSGETAAREWKAAARRRAGLA